jgi:hypothetical protein
MTKLYLVDVGESLKFEDVFFEAVLRHEVGAFAVMMVAHVHIAILHQVHLEQKKALWYKSCASLLPFFLWSLVIPFPVNFGCRMLHYESSLLFRRMEGRTENLQPLGANFTPLGNKVHPWGSKFASWEV